MESLGAPKVILGVLGLYKPNAPGLVLDAQSFSGTGLE
jgi:hypothetical protein